MNCPYCNNETVHKNGNKYNKQRYICPKCSKSFSLTDNRIKRDNKEREMALLLYCHNVSIRSIQSVLNKYFNTNISFNVIDNWIKTNAKQLKLDVDNNIKNNNSYNKNNINDNTDNNNNKDNNNKDNNKYNNNNNNKDNNNNRDNNNNIDNNSNKDNNNNNNISNNKPKTIGILELDELYTYFYDIKKNSEKMSKYGLLLIDSEIKLLHIK